MTNDLNSPNPLRRVAYFPYVGAATICVGIYLHVTRLFLDPAELIAKIYTPNFDLALFIPMLYTAICMLVFRGTIARGKRWRTVVYWIIATYFWISVPIHLRAQVTQSNDFVFAFPRWYSVILLPWLALQLYFLMTMKVKRTDLFLNGLGAAHA